MTVATNVSTTSASPAVRAVTVIVDEPVPLPGVMRSTPVVGS